jgi:hypothetical protein
MMMMIMQHMYSFHFLEEMVVALAGSAAVPQAGEVLADDVKIQSMAQGKEEDV